MPEAAPDKFDQHRQRCSGCNFYSPIDEKQGRCRINQQSGKDKVVRSEFHCDRNTSVYIGTG